AVEPRVPVGPDGSEHPVADLGGEPALADGDHAKGGGPCYLVRAGGREVLDPVARVAARVLARRGVERVEREVDRTVADRVRGAPRQPAWCAAMIIRARWPASACR